MGEYQAPGRVRHQQPGAVGGEIKDEDGGLHRAVARAPGVEHPPASRQGRDTRPLIRRSSRGERCTARLVPPSAETRRRSVARGQVDDGPVVQPGGRQIAGVHIRGDRDGASAFDRDLPEAATQSDKPDPPAIGREERRHASLRAGHRPGLGLVPQLPHQPGGITDRISEDDAGAVGGDRGLVALDLPILGRGMATGAGATASPADGWSRPRARGAASPQRRDKQQRRRDVARCRRSAARRDSGAAAASAGRAGGVPSAAIRIRQRRRKLRRAGEPVRRQLLQRGEHRGLDLRRDGLPLRGESRRLGRSSPWRRSPAPWGR